MKLLILTLLVGSVLSAPTSSSSSSESKEDDKLTITKEFFPDEFKVYSSEHDIVQILVPLNALNFADDTDDEDEDVKKVIFFIEADVKDGVKDYKGLSVMIRGKVTKLLDTATDVSVANDDSKTAYISATDGIYVYDEKENKAVKYGTIKDNLIAIAKLNGSDEMYVLNNKNEVYKISDNGNQATKLDKVVGAKQIVLDYSNNLYYYGEDKKPFVFDGEDVKPIEGLPSDPDTVELIKPPFIFENKVPFIVDKEVYVIYANGSSEKMDLELDVKPTAYSAEATLIQYYAYNKSIYEYNILSLLMSEVMNELKNFLNNITDEIHAIATRSRSNFRA